MKASLRLLAAVACVAFASPAFAQARIHAVSYDLVSGALVITGEDLKIAAGPTTVKLAGTALAVLSSTATSVTAQLPPNTTAGEYQVFLKRTANLLEAAVLGEASYSLSILQPVPGPQGPEGPRGPAGFSGYTVMTAVSPNDSAESRIVTASCPAGKLVFGGGQVISPVSAATYRAIGVSSSRPSPGNNGWTAAAIEVPTSYGANWQLTVYAICGTIAP